MGEHTCILYAQQPGAWQAEADQYLTTIIKGDTAFETPDHLEALRQALTREFKTGKLDAALVHWLAVWNARLGDSNTEEYYQEVLKRYEKQAYPRALFIMDYCRFDFRFDKKRR